MAVELQIRCPSLDNAGGDLEILTVCGRCKTRQPVADLALLRCSDVGEEAADLALQALRLLGKLIGRG
jgi:hypothetical protein